MSNPPEPAMHHHQIKLLIFLPLRADLLCILHYETPCIGLKKLVQKLVQKIDSQKILYRCTYLMEAQESFKCKTYISIGPPLSNKVRQYSG